LWALYVSCAAALISLIAVSITATITNKNRLQSAMPVLVFGRPKPKAGEKWYLQNVGNGPALNIHIYNRASNTPWTYVASCYPIAAKDKDSSFSLTAGAALVVTYTDLWGKIYFTYCAGDINHFFRKHKYSLLLHWKEFRIRMIYKLLPKNPWARYRESPNPIEMPRTSDPHPEE